MSPIYMILIIPLFFICMGVEYLIGWLKNKSEYRYNDFITNLNIGVGNQVFNLFTKGMIVGLFVWIQQNYALVQQPATWWSFVLCFVLFDFLFYWAHRWSHEVNFLWGAHVVHHQSEEYNLSVALRQSWFHNALAFFIFLPIPFLGFEPGIFLAAAGVNTLYQFWIHTKEIKKLPRWFEFVFNTPSHHRVHHAVDPKYIDKNHAGTLIIWDRLFGTFMEEEEEPVYGITKPLDSWNPSWANVHYYVEMWQQMKRMNRWQDKLRMLVARPGWLPDELGGYTPPPKPDYENLHKYDADQTSPGMKLYVLMQFIFIIAGSMAYMYHFTEISLFYKIAFFSIIILSTMICGAIFENKRWVKVAEYVRLAVALASINTLYYYFYVDWFSIMLAISVCVFAVFAVWFTISGILYAPPKLEGVPSN